MKPISFLHTGSWTVCVSGPGAELSSDLQEESAANHVTYEGVSELVRQLSEDEHIQTSVLILDPQVKGFTSRGQTHLYPAV
ncbi:hypothetical protein LDENG_00093560 [Lucifuga dentata]|nr:hypothetical protein LDENG_00093560 [Lucifuga dentata]